MTIAEKKKLLHNYRFIDAILPYYEDRLQELDEEILLFQRELHSPCPSTEVKSLMKAVLSRQEDLAQQQSDLIRKKLQVEAAIEAMTDYNLRKVILVRFVGGLSQFEAAAALNYSEGYFWKLENKAINAIDLEP